MKGVNKMAKKKTVKTVQEDTFDYDKPRNPIELYLAKALGENVTLPDTDTERILVYLRKLIEVIEQGGGTEVIANPTLAGTEDDLTGMQVGDTKYKVGGAPKLYRNSIKMTFSTPDSNIIIVFYSFAKLPATMTFSDVVNLLLSYGVNTDYWRGLISSSESYASYIENNITYYTHDVWISSVSSGGSITFAYTKFSGGTATIFSKNDANNIYVNSVEM